MAPKTRAPTLRAVTYIGGLHSPPVSQPTAIHQDIQLVGEEAGGQAGGASAAGRLRPGSRWGSSWHRWRTCSPAPRTSAKEKKTRSDLAGVPSQVTSGPCRCGETSHAISKVSASTSGSRIQPVVPRNQLWPRSGETSSRVKTCVCVCVCSDHLGRRFFFHPVLTHRCPPAPPVTVQSPSA